MCACECAREHTSVACLYVRVCTLLRACVSVTFVFLQFGPFSVPASSNLYFYFNVFDLISARTTLASLKFCCRVFSYGDEAAKQRRLNNPVTLSPSADLSFLVSQSSSSYSPASIHISYFWGGFPRHVPLPARLFFSNKEENY